MLRPTPGHTTADAVRRRLGRPDYATDDGSFFGYLMESFLEPGGVEIYEGEKPKGPTYSKVIRNLLVMEFDHNGVLRRYKSKRVPEDAIPSDYFALIARPRGASIKRTHD